eukprot:jgi/Bigna1/68141/fgenesh1_pg.5_\
MYETMSSVDQDAAQIPSLNQKTTPSNSSRKRRPLETIGVNDGSFRSPLPKSRKYYRTSERDGSQEAHDDRFEPVFLSPPPLTPPAFSPQMNSRESRPRDATRNWSQHPTNRAFNERFREATAIPIVVYQDPVVAARNAQIDGSSNQNFTDQVKDFIYKMIVADEISILQSLRASSYVFDESEVAPMVGSISMPVDYWLPVSQVYGDSTHLPIESKFTKKNLDAHQSRTREKASPVRFSRRLRRRKGDPLPPRDFKEVHDNSFIDCKDVNEKSWTRSEKQEAKIVETYLARVTIFHISFGYRD